MYFKIVSLTDFKMSENRFKFDKTLFKGASWLAVYDYLKQTFGDSLIIINSEADSLRLLDDLREESVIVINSYGMTVDQLSTFNELYAIDQKINGVDLPSKTPVLMIGNESSLSPDVFNRLRTVVTVEDPVSFKPLETIDVNYDALVEDLNAYYVLNTFENENPKLLKPSSRKKTILILDSLTMSASLEMYLFVNNLSVAKLSASQTQRLLSRPQRDTAEGTPISAAQLRSRIFQEKSLDFKLGNDYNFVVIDFKMLADPVGSQLVYQYCLKHELPIIRRVENWVINRVFQTEPLPPNVSDVMVIPESEPSDFMKKHFNLPVNLNRVDTYQLSVIETLLSAHQGPTKNSIQPRAILAAHLMYPKYQKYPLLNFPINTEKLHDTKYVLSLFGLKLPDKNSLVLTDSSSDLLLALAANRLFATLINSKPASYRISDIKGFVVEGVSGSGKDATIGAGLKANNYDYLHLNANSKLPEEEIKYAIRRCHFVIVSEANLLSRKQFIRLINLFNNRLYLLIITKNPPGYAGRNDSEIQDLLDYYFRFYDMKPPSVNDLFMLVTHKAGSVIDPCYVNEKICAALALFHDALSSKLRARGIGFLPSMRQIEFVLNSELFHKNITLYELKSLIKSNYIHLTVFFTEEQVDSLLADLDDINDSEIELLKLNSNKREFKFIINSWFTKVYADIPDVSFYDGDEGKYEIVREKLPQIRYSDEIGDIHEYRITVKSLAIPHSWDKNQLQLFLNRVLLEYLTIKMYEKDNWLEEYDLNRTYIPMAYTGLYNLPLVERTINHQLRFILFNDRFSCTPFERHISSLGGEPDSCLAKTLHVSSVFPRDVFSDDWYRRRTILESDSYFLDPQLWNLNYDSCCTNNRYKIESVSVQYDHVEAGVGLLGFCNRIEKQDVCHFYYQLTTVDYRELDLVRVVSNDPDLSFELLTDLDTEFSREHLLFSLTRQTYLDGDFKNVYLIVSLDPSSKRSFGWHYFSFQIVYREEKLLPVKDEADMLKTVGYYVGSSGLNTDKGECVHSMDFNTKHLLEDASFSEVIAKNYTVYKGSFGVSDMYLRGRIIGEHQGDLRDYKQMAIKNASDRLITGELEVLPFATKCIFIPSPFIATHISQFLVDGVSIDVAKLKINQQGFIYYEIPSNSHPRNLRWRCCEGVQINILPPQPNRNNPVFHSIRAYEDKFPHDPIVKQLSTACTLEEPARFESIFKIFQEGVSSFVAESLPRTHTANTVSTWATLMQHRKGCCRHIAFLFYHYFMYLNYSARMVRSQSAEHRFLEVFNPTSKEWIAFDTGDFTPAEKVLTEKDILFELNTPGTTWTADLFKDHYQKIIDPSPRLRQLAKVIDSPQLNDDLANLCQSNEGVLTLVLRELLKANPMSMIMTFVSQMTPPPKRQCFNIPLDVDWDTIVADMSFLADHKALPDWQVKLYEVSYSSTIKTYINSDEVSRHKDVFKRYYTLFRHLLTDDERIKLERLINLDELAVGPFKADVLPIRTMDQNCDQEESGECFPNPTSLNFSDCVKTENGRVILDKGYTVRLFLDATITIYSVKSVMDSLIQVYKGNDIHEKPKLSVITPAGIIVVRESDFREGSRSLGNIISCIEASYFLLPLNVDYLMCLWSSEKGKRLKGSELPPVSESDEMQWIKNLEVGTIDYGKQCEDAARVIQRAFRQYFVDKKVVFNSPEAIQKVGDRAYEAVAERLKSNPQISQFLLKSGDSNFCDLSTIDLTSIQPYLQLLFFNYRNLTSLSLDSCGLTAFPSGVCSHIPLMYLYLSDNNISTVPPEVGNLTHLKTLSLTNNKLESLPKELGNLKYLVLLAIRGNNITSIPSELGQIEHLTLYSDKSKRARPRGNCQIS